MPDRAQSSGATAFHAAWAKTCRTRAGTEGWVLRRLYRPLIDRTVARFDAALRSHPPQP